MKKLNEEVFKTFAADSESREKLADFKHKMNIRSPSDPVKVASKPLLDMVSKNADIKSSLDHEDEEKMLDLYSMILDEPEASIIPIPHAAQPSTKMHNKFHGR